MLSKLTVARHLEFIAKYFYRAEEINGPLEEYKFSIGQRAENHLTLIFLSSSGWEKILPKKTVRFFIMDLEKLHFFENLCEILFYVIFLGN